MNESQGLSQFEAGLLYAVFPALTFAAVKRIWGDMETAIAGALFAEVLAVSSQTYDFSEYFPDGKTLADRAADLTTLVALSSGVGMLTYAACGELDLAVIFGGMAGVLPIVYWNTLSGPQGSTTSRPAYHWFPPPPIEYGELQEFADSVLAQEMALGDVRKEHDLPSRGRMIEKGREEVRQLSQVMGLKKEHTSKTEMEDRAKSNLDARIKRLSGDLRQLHNTWKIYTVRDSFAAGGWATFDAGGAGNCFAYSVALHEDKELGTLLLKGYNADLGQQDAIVEELKVRLTAVAEKLKLKIEELGDEHPHTKDLTVLKERAEQTKETQPNGDFKHWVTTARNPLLDFANFQIRTRLHKWATDNRAQIEEAARITIYSLWKDDRDLNIAVKAAVNDDELCERASKDPSLWPEEAVTVLIDRILWWQAGPASWFDDTTLGWYTAEQGVQVAVFDKPRFHEQKLVPTHYLSEGNRHDDALANRPIRYVWFMGNHYRPVFKLPQDQGIGDVDPSVK